jgi:hypothetical protein
MHTLSVYIKFIEHHSWLRIGPHGIKMPGLLHRATAGNTSLPGISDPDIFVEDLFEFGSQFIRHHHTKDLVQPGLSEIHPLAAYVC